MLLVLASTIGARCVYALPRSPVVDALRVQLRPSVGEGLTLADFCLPMFGFVAGASLALSFARREEAGERSWMFLKRSLLRGGGLFVIGGVMSAVRFSWPDFTRIDPLQQLAVCIVLGAVTATIARPWPARLATAVILLIQSPIPMVPMLTLVLAGLAAGTYLRKNLEQPRRVIIGLAVTGLVATNISVIANQLSRNLDSTTPTWGTPAWGTPAWKAPTDVMAASGVICLVLAAAYGATLMSGGDRRWLAMPGGTPLRVLGRNSLLVIVLIKVIPLAAVSNALVDGEIAEFLGATEPLVRAGIELLVAYLPAYVLYRKRLFLTI